MLEGAIDVFEDGSTRRVGARELFAVEPRTLHRYSAVEDCRLLVIVFDGGLLEFAQADVASRRYIEPYRAGTLTVRNPVRDEGGTIGAAFEEIRRRYAQCKEDWKRDRRNPFKDGKFLAYFEMLRMIPAAQ